MSATIPADRRLSASRIRSSGSGGHFPARAVGHPGVLELVRPGERPARGRGTDCRNDLLLIEPSVLDKSALRLAGSMVKPAVLCRDGLVPGSVGQTPAPLRAMVRASAHRFPLDPARADFVEPAGLSGSLGDPGAGSGAAAGLISGAARYRARRRLLLSFPGLLGLALILVGWVVGGDWLAEWREAGRPMPPGNPPNVLLITLDTVGADHLSLYGYGRPTSPVLERLASSGIRFDAARAAAPWTLPSHATMFTGRWHHDLNVNWTTPLNKQYRTLAEHLGARGFATAGFVANTYSCSYDSGLNRGFTHYEDYVLEYLVPFRTAWLVDHLTRLTSDLVKIAGWVFGIGPSSLLHESRLSPYLVGFLKKDGAWINRAFLDWLSHRRPPARPFFAFLNYFDAHDPYVLPVGARYRFGLIPRKPADFVFLGKYWELADKLTLRPVYRRFGEDSYDNCVAYLDEQLGGLFEELQRRGELDRTLVIVTSDHGEGFGQHDLFGHGESLYRPEIHVPLVIVLPAGQRTTGIVCEPVSLRDLPATILDLAGCSEGSPFPGRSLAELWRRPSAGGGPARNRSGDLRTAQTQSL